MHKLSSPQRISHLDSLDTHTFFFFFFNQQKCKDKFLALKTQNEAGKAGILGVGCDCKYRGQENFAEYLTFKQRLRGDQRSSLGSVWGIEARKQEQKPQGNSRDRQRSKMEAD